MYANPYAGINLLPSLSLARRRARLRATRRASATTLAALHAARSAEDRAIAAAALPAYTEIDYAAFRAQVDSRGARAHTRQFITRGNSVLIAGQKRQVLAKLELPWIDHWGVVHSARYFAPTRACRIPLRAWLALAIPLHLSNLCKPRTSPFKLLGSPLKLLSSTLIKIQRSCKTAGLSGRAVYRRLASMIAAHRAPRPAAALRGEPHWTSIRLTA